MVVEIRNNGFYKNGEYFFPIGVNYWPRDTAVNLWTKYQPQAIEREFEIMHQTGINCIRCFIRWEDLTPELNQINEDFFAKFDHFHQLAIKYGVYLNPTLFIGHMSGQDWFPHWFILSEEDIAQGAVFQEISLPPDKKVRGKVRDIYRDETVYEQAFLQLEALLPRYKDSEIIISWDLSNENQYWMHPKSPADAQIYMRRLYEKMHMLDPNHPITLGMGKINENTGFNCYGEFSISPYNNYHSVHTYPRHYYPIIIPYISLYVTYKPQFDVRMAFNLTGIPIQFQEFGLSYNAFMGYRKVTKNYMLAGYYANAMWGVLLGGARCGILAWDFCDFAPELIKTHPYTLHHGEMNFGNFDNQYRLKSSGQELQRFAKFTQNFNLENFIEIPSEIGIVMPENYNDYITLNTSLKDLSDDDPMKKVKSNHKTLDCMENQNKALFSAFICCRMIGIMPNFVNPNEDWTQYKLLLFPNLKQMSEQSAEKLSAFINQGGWAYISTNQFLPSNLDVKGWDMIKPNKTDLTPRKSMMGKFNPGKEVNAEVVDHLKSTKIYQQELHYFDLVQYLTGLPSDFQLIGDTGNNNSLIACFPSKQGNGGIVVNGTAPEINHTSKRNAFKKENMHLLYRSLADLAGIDINLQSSDISVECGQLINQNQGQHLIILINHMNEKRTIEITLPNGIEEISSVLGEKKIIKTDIGFNITLNRYEVACFLWISK